MPETLTSIKVPVKLIQRVKIAHSFLQSVSNHFKVQMKCLFLLLNLKEQQKSGRSLFTVSLISLLVPELKRFKDE